MKETKMRFFTFVALGVLAGSLSAQTKNVADDIVIPFDLRDHVILVHCRINDSTEVYDFIVDTGGLSMVDKSLADKLNMKQIGPQAKINSLQVGGYAAGKVIFFTQFDFKQFIAAYGMTVHGMIGSDFLEDFVVTIDYDRRQLVLSTDAEALARHKSEKATGCLLKFKKHPINHAPMIPCRLNDGPEVAAMVDTGQPFPLVLPLDYLEKTGVLKGKGALKAKGVIVKWPGTTNRDNYLARLKTFTSGSLKVDNIITAFAELPALLSGPLLGKDFLAQYLVVIDYPRGELLLKPRAAKPVPTNWFSAGLKISANAENLLEVAGVWEKSPADRAGIRVGERVLGFNGKPLTLELHQELWLLLNNDNVKEVEIELQGEKGPRKVRLKKENLL